MIAYIRAAVAGCDCHKVHPNFGGRACVTYKTLELEHQVVLGSSQIVVTLVIFQEKVVVGQTPRI